MNCTQCGYTLWNIRDRRCPECGRAFLPSQFEFVINSVRYCCPRCEQDYYGTGERGHLLPRSFSCVRCGTALDMDEMVLLPTEGVSESQTQVGHNPWAERPGFKAFFGTFSRSLGSPVRVARAAGSSGAVRPGRALVFATILNTAAFVLSGVWLALLPFFTLGGIVWSGRGVGAWSVAIAMLLTMVLVFPLLPRVWSLTTHLLLRWTGRVHGGRDLTTAAICYTSAPLFLSAIPCVSLYVGWAGYLWWLAAATVAVKELQRVQAWRAVVATIAPVLALGLLLGGGLVWGIWLMTAQGAAAMAAAQANAAAPASAAAVAAAQANAGSAMWTPPSAPAMSLAMETHLATNGRWPVHGSELLTMPTNGLTAENIAGSPADHANVKFGGVSLSDLRGASSEILAVEFANATPKLPDGVIAHRYGDWVFTYHGQALGTGEEGESGGGGETGLWYAVLLPTSVAAADSLVQVIERHGVTRAFPSSHLTAQVVSQNEIRVGAGLPPLPLDLGGVTAESPAVRP